MYRRPRTHISSLCFARQCRSSLVRCAVKRACTLVKSNFRNSSVGSDPCYTASIAELGQHGLDRRLASQSADWVRLNMHHCSCMRGPLDTRPLRVYLTAQDANALLQSQRLEPPRSAWCRFGSAMRFTGFGSSERRCGRYPLLTTTVASSALRKVNYLLVSD